MALKVADGRGICHQQKTRFADGKVEPSEKLLSPMAGPSATKAHRQPSSLPVAPPSATKSHRPKIFFTDGRAIGRTPPSAKLAKSGRPQTPSRLPMATANGRPWPRGSLGSAQAHLVCRWPAVGIACLPMAFQGHRQTINFFLFFSSQFFLVSS